MPIAPPPHHGRHGGADPRRRTHAPPGAGAWHRMWRRRSGRPGAPCGAGGCDVLAAPREGCDTRLPAVRGDPAVPLRLPDGARLGCLAPDGGEFDMLVRDAAGNDAGRMLRTGARIVPGYAQDVRPDGAPAPHRTAPPSPDPSTGPPPHSSSRAGAGQLRRAGMVPSRIPGVESTAPCQSAPPGCPHPRIWTPQGRLWPHRTCLPVSGTRPGRRTSRGLTDPLLETAPRRPQHRLAAWRYGASLSPVRPPSRAGAGRHSHTTTAAGLSSALWGRLNPGMRGSLECVLVGFLQSPTRMDRMRGRKSTRSCGWNPLLGYL